MLATRTGYCAKRMVRPPLLVPLLLLSSLVLRPLAAQGLSESIEVRVLEIEAVVLDKSGKVVEGLAKDDFEVTLGGKRVDIESFFGVRKGEPGSEEGEETSEGSSVATAIPTSLVIFVDDTRLTQRSKLRALEALDQYVRANVGPLTTAMLVQYDGELHLRVRPTEHPGYLLRELEIMKKRPALLGTTQTDRRQIIGEMDYLFSQISERRPVSLEATWAQLGHFAERESREVRDTISALREAMGVAAGFSGRKALLYVSEGLPQHPAAELFDYWQKAAARSTAYSNAVDARKWGPSDMLRYDMTREFHHLSSDAQRMNIAFFSFDPLGLRGYEGTSVEESGGIRMATIDSTMMRESLHGGVRYLAGETGGRFIGNENNLGLALEKISAQFSTFYSIGVQPPARLRRAEVRVTVKKRPDLRVVTARRRAPLTFDEEVAQSLRTRLYTLKGENPLSADVFIGVPAVLAGRCTIPVGFAVPREKLTLEPGWPTVGLHFVLLDERNLESGIRSAKLPVESEGPFLHRFALGVEPQKYVMSVALVDSISHETSYLQREIDATGCGEH